MIFPTLFNILYVSLFFIFAMYFTYAHNATHAASAGCSMRYWQLAGRLWIVEHLLNELMSWVAVCPLFWELKRCADANVWLLCVQELIHGDPESQEKFVRLKEAYDVLSDSSSHTEYDAQLGLITKGSAPSLQSHVRLIIVSLSLLFSLPCGAGSN